MAEADLRRRVSAVAVVAAAANLIAGAVMFFWLRHGIPAGEQAAALRRSYIASHIMEWRLGWIAWNVAALSLIALLASLSVVWRDRAPIAATVALALAAAGLAADLAAESILAGVIPSASASSFHALERTADMLTGYLGNGLYTIAGILITWIGHRRLPPAFVALGAAAWICGLWLSAATLLGSRDGQFLSAGLLMPLFIGWAASVAFYFRRPAGQ